MHLIGVNDKKTAKDFIQVNIEINKNDPNYIHPLEKDINEIFDSKKNKTFRHGEGIRWILKDENEKLIGRIAAFTNKKYKNKGDDVPVGGIGFFDCINDQQAADMLFDVAKHWLLQKGMQAMDGPINFGERDRWWGLIVKGFEPPLYSCSGPMDLKTFLTRSALRYLLPTRYNKNFMTVMQPVLLIPIFLQHILKKIS